MIHISLYTNMMEEASTLEKSTPRRTTTTEQICCGSIKIFSYLDWSAVSKCVRGTFVQWRSVTQAVVVRIQNTNKYVNRAQKRYKKRERYADHFRATGWHAASFHPAGTHVCSFQKISRPAGPRSGFVCTLVTKPTVQLT